MTTSLSPMADRGTRRHTVVPSPIGDLLLVADGDHLVALLLAPHHDEVALGGPTPPAADDDVLLGEVRRQLEEYFAGDRTEFDVPIAPEGTEFQRAVWAGLLTIPYGETLSYGELADRIGRPNAQRAVGLANGRNPISVIVPCHRVIGADGSLTGYGGGLDRKQHLLALEQGASPLPL